MAPLVLNLKKGEAATLRGSLKYDVLMLGLSWSPRKTPGPDLDADPGLFPRDKAGTTRIEWICYFNNSTVGDWMRHSGDDRTGAGKLAESEDAEEMWIDLKKVPAEVMSIDFVITMFEGAQRNETFGDLEWGVVRLCNVPAMDTNIGEEKIRISLTEDQLFSVTGFLAARLVRRGPTWEIVRLDDTGAGWADFQSAANMVSIPK